MELVLGWGNRVWEEHMNMKYWIFGCLLLGVVMLTSPAGAQIPDQVGITGSTPWLVAGGGERATISVEVLDGTTPLAGLDVAFSVDAAYGSITPASGVTDANGRATATFTPGTLSGDAPITVRVTYPDGEIIQDYLQQIDHAAPYSVAGIDYAAEVPVDTTTNVTVRLVDRYGNPIDNRNTAESVIFSVGSADGTAGFVSGEECVSTVSREVDGAGAALAVLRVGQRAGDNIVVIDVPDPLVDPPFVSILGVADGNPDNIVGYAEPNPAVLPADGESMFFLTFVVRDRYGNAVQDTPVSITNSRGGEANTFLTNSLGQVTLSYGPTVRIGEVTLTATAAENDSVSAARTVEFVSDDPVNMVLTANPEVMASRDVNDSISSIIRAKVVDIRGNPVENEPVSFALRNVDIGGYTEIASPELSSSVAVTDSNGYADITFRPGAFTNDILDPGFNSTASGTCEVAATWGEITRNVTLTWKNYPYLSIETTVDPENGTVDVNETIDVGIRLRGDGWVVQQMLPLDIVLCIDRGEDMLLNDTANKKEGWDRMIYAREAAWNFTEFLALGDNRVGLVTFGDMSIDTLQHAAPAEFVDGYVDLINLPNTYNWKKNLAKDGNANDDVIAVNSYYPGNGRIRYLDFAEVVKPLDSGTWLDIRTSLWDIVPANREKTGEATAPLRKGLHAAIKHLEVNGRPGAVKAVVVLMQNKYCYYGDPFGPENGGSPMACDPDDKSLASGTADYYAFGDCDDENMAAYASAHGIKIYPIYYANSGSTSEEDVPRELAGQTGGRYFMAEDYFELEAALRDITLLLRDEASVNTEMDVTFESVTVNSNPVPGDDAFAYVYAPPTDSTRIYSYNRTATIIPAYARDDTLNWTENQTLHFDVGTIRVGQIWETSFRLRVLEAGNIEIFGENSYVTFNNGTDTVKLPALAITALPTGVSAPLGVVNLSVDDLQFTGDPARPVYDLLPLAWNVNYTGVHEVAEDLYYRSDGVSWIYLCSKTADNTTTADTYTVDVTDMAAGEYTFKVYATAPDAPDSATVLAVPVRVKDLSRAYIQIR
ncbi:hypothetical protein FGU65_11380 [Methanoculleus sp. FWC-SCC1]|uniref:Big-1 domain-containing protein n=1 Tax=Methanoculleus frigidifontis TaxID=2584085 RepID=A0ABT8MC16_9EURY|nr:Ig-like domain-containing protein [Methanoculleus sp. FWC-SCC1]MDN7025482.1 hypothetical protein [Methanoculleus sp. FWC-SCC1]